MTLDESRHHTGAIGRVIPTYQARLVDAENGKDVEIGERGELWLKGGSHKECFRRWMVQDRRYCYSGRPKILHVCSPFMSSRALADLNILQYCRQSKGAYQVQRLPSATGRA